MYRIYEAAKASIFDNYGGKIPSPQTLIIALFFFYHFSLLATAMIFSVGVSLVIRSSLSKQPGVKLLKAVPVTLHK